MAPDFDLVFSLGALIIKMTFLKQNYNLNCILNGIGTILCFKLKYYLISSHLKCSDAIYHFASLSQRTNFLQRIIENSSKMVNLIDFDDDEDDFSDLMPTTGRRSTALSFTDDPGTIRLFQIFGPFLGRFLIENQLVLILRNQL